MANGLSGLRRLADGGPVRRPGDPVVGTRGPARGPTGGGLSSLPTAERPRPVQKQGIAGLPTDPLRNPRGIVRAREAAAGLADGGRVKGRGGRTSDHVGPVMLSDEEYVLPADTADAIGRDNLDELRLRTHKFKDPRNAQGLANGGSPLFTDLDPKVFRERPGPTNPVNFQSHGRSGFQQPPQAAQQKWGPEGSAEAQKFRASGAGNPSSPGPSGPKKPTLASRAGKAWAGKPGGIVRGVAGPGMMAGAVAAGGFNDYKIQDDVDSSAMGTLGYIGRGEGGKAWESVKKGAVETGLDLLSGGAKVADTVGGWFGQNPELASGLRQRVESDLGSSVKIDDSVAGGAAPVPAAPTGEQGTPAAPTGEQGTPADVRRVDDGLGAQYGAPAAASTGEVNPAGSTVRQLGGGIRRIDQRGESPLYTNRADPNAPMSFEPLSEEQAAANLQRTLAGIERASLAQKRLLDVQRGIQDHGDPDFYSPESTEARRKEFQELERRQERDAIRQEAERITKRAERQEQWDRSARQPDQFSWRGGRGRRGGDGGQGGRGLGTAAALESLGLRQKAAHDQATLEAQQAYYATTAQNAATQRAVALRGQDITLRGQNATDARSRETEARRRQESDRSYQLNVAKHGADQANKMYEQRQAAVKQTSERIATMLPPGRDGKPDAYKAAQYTEALNAMVGERMSALEQHLARNPNDQQAQAELEALSTRGLSALDEKDVRNFVAGMQAKEVSRDSAGWMPWSGTDVDSAAPITGLKRREGVIWDDYVDDQGRVIPAHRLDKEGGVLGFGGRRSTRYDTLKR